MKRQTACGRRLASTRRVGAALHAGAAATTKRKTRPKTRPRNEATQADAAVTPTLPRRRPSSSRRPRLVQQCEPDGLRRNSSDTAAPFAAPEPDFRRLTTGSTQVSSKTGQLHRTRFRLAQRSEQAQGAVVDDRVGRVPGAQATRVQTRAYSRERRSRPPLRHEQRVRGSAVMATRRRKRTSRLRP